MPCWLATNVCLCIKSAEESICSQTARYQFPFVISNIYLQNLVTKLSLSFDNFVDRHIENLRPIIKQQCAVILLQRFVLHLLLSNRKGRSYILIDNVTVEA